MVIGFTGHRPERIVSIAELENIIRKVLHSLVFVPGGELDTSVRFVIGGAPGFDTLVAETLWSWAINPEQIDIIIPFIGFERYSTKHLGMLSRAESINNSLLSDRVHTPHSDGSFGVKCNLRNQEIINRSDKLIAYWDGSKKGGTYNTIQMAIRKGIPVLNLYDGVEVSENTGKVVLAEKD